MSGDRYVVAGLAPTRSRWFEEVTRWATVGSIPVEFVKCVSAAELRARLGTGRRFSAVIVDGSHPAADRDLLATARDRSAVPIVVASRSDQDRWIGLGAAAVLDEPFERIELVAALTEHARPIARVVGTDALAAASTSEPDRWRAPLVAVVGRPGVGCSTVAAALAQGLAEVPGRDGGVVLADLALHAHQGLLHDAGDLVPALTELVEAFRAGPPTATTIRSLLHQVPHRGYSLLLGLRRHRDWVSLPARATAAAIDGLQGAARVVVADVEGDLEGEDDTGSFDVEDRNRLARLAVRRAAVVLAVGTPTTTGLAGAVGLLGDLRRTGVESERTLVVLNRSPRSPRARAQLSSTVATLAAGSMPSGSGATHAGTVFVPARRGMDDLHRDVARFPGPVTRPLVTAAEAALSRVGDVSASTGLDDEPVPIRPGSLGHWTDESDQPA